MMPRADLIRADRALWRAVISQAISDVVLTSTKPADRHHAMAWLTSNSADFRHVCALADLEPQRVRAFATAEIERVGPLTDALKPRPSPAPELPVIRIRTRPPAAPPRAKAIRTPKPKVDRTAQPQMHRRTMVVFEGRRIDLMTLCQQRDVNLSMVRDRLRHGWTLDDALSRPTTKLTGENKARRLTVEFNGQSVDLMTLCERHGVALSPVYQRLRRGWTIEAALTAPVRQTGGRSKLQANEQGPAGVHPHKIEPNSGFSA